MKNKILFLFTFFMIILSFNNVNALEKKELKELNLTKTITYSLKEGYQYVQGGTVTDKYIVLAEINDETDNTLIKVIDKDTLKTEKVIDYYSFGHANDMTYNKKNNKVIIAPGSGKKKLYILNGNTFKLEKTINTRRGYSSIGYDELNNQYIARHSSTVYVLDLGFNEVSNFSMSAEGLTPQGLEVNNGKIYYTCYEAGGVTKYQSKYTGVLDADENIIIVYDIATMKKEKIYYIPQVTKEGFYPGEVEGISFIGNVPVVWSNSNGGISLFKPVIKRINTRISLSVRESNIDLANNNIVLELYKNSRLVSSARNYYNKFKFTNITYNEETKDRYNLRIRNNNYTLNTNELDVNVYYDFFDNNLHVSYNDKISLIK